MSERYILDAWGNLALLQGEEPAARRVHQLFELAREGRVELAISIINLGEVYYRIGRSKGLAEADETLADLRRLPLVLLPAGEEQVLAAARLKARYAISYADAFALAAAGQLGGILVTGDPELVALQGRANIEILSRWPEGKT